MPFIFALILLTLLSFSRGVQAGITYSQDSFFDFEFATQFWGKPSRQNWDDAFVEYCTDDKFIKSWGHRYQHDPRPAVEFLQASPDIETSETLQQCYDLFLTYSTFDNIYSVWRKRAVEGWNNNENHRFRDWIEELNIFTGQMNDIPDWR